MFKVDTKPIRREERKVWLFTHKGLPHATRDAVNQTAFAARKIWNDHLKKEMTLRNTFTTRQVRVVKASGTSIATMQSKLGSLADYMDEREHGETKHKRGKHGVAIPTAAAAGQTGRKRTKLIRKAFALKAIRLHGRVSGSEAQRNAASIRIARKSGRKIAYLEKGNRRGLVRVGGTRRKPTFKTIYDLSRPSVRVAPEPTLAHTVEQARRLMPVIYLHSLRTQAKRHGL